MEICINIFKLSENNLIFFFFLMKAMVKENLQEITVPNVKEEESFKKVRK